MPDQRRPQIHPLFHCAGQSRIHEIDPGARDSLACSSPVQRQPGLVDTAGDVPDRAVHEVPVPGPKCESYARSLNNRTECPATHAKQDRLCPVCFRCVCTQGCLAIHGKPPRALAQSRMQERRTQQRVGLFQRQLLQRGHARRLAHAAAVHHGRVVRTRRAAARRERPSGAVRAAPALRPAGDVRQRLRRPSACATQPPARGARTSPPDQTRHADTARSGRGVAGDALPAIRRQSNQHLHTRERAILAPMGCLSELRRGSITLPPAPEASPAPPPSS
jgi:hypothetical protein